MSSSTFRLQTAGGIPYKLMEGYPKINVTDEKTTGTEKYLINASNVSSFVLESLPPPVILGNFYFRAPRRRMPGAGFLNTATLSFEPHTGEKPGDPFYTDLGLSSDAHDETYDPLYMVTIQYETGKDAEDDERDEDDPETFLEHSVSGGGEFLSIPSQNTKVAEGDVETSVSQSDQVNNSDRQMPMLKTIPTIEHTLKWEYVINPNWDQIFLSLGHVNDRELSWLFNSPAETCLFMGVSGNQTYTWDGATTRIQPWTLDFKFSQRYISEVVTGDAGQVAETYGWNHAYSPRLGKWVYVYRASTDDNGQKKLYDEVDFRDMFKT